MSIWTGGNLAAMGRYFNGVEGKGQGGKATYGGAVGVVNITLEQGLAANECAILVTPEFTAANVAPAYFHASNTLKQVITKDTTNANINVNFSWGVFQLPAT